MLKIALGIGCALAFASPSAEPQERRGTIAVMRYEPTRLIVAADSRESFRNTVGSPPHEDRACKVAALGKHAVFVIAGFTGYDNNGPLDRIQTWRGIDLARRAYDDLVTRHGEWQDEHLDELVRGWGERMRARIADLDRANPLVLRATANSSGLLTKAMVATGRAKTVQAAEVDISIDMLGKIEVTSRRTGPKGCPLCALGRGEIFVEFAENKSERAKLETERFGRETQGLSAQEREVRRVIRLVQVTIDLHPDRNEVGGPVDALQLTAGEAVRWIQRKPECPD